MFKKTAILAMLLGACTRPVEKGELCAPGKHPPSDTVLGKLLEAGQDKFATPASKAAAPEEFVAHMDQVVRESGHAFLLDCRDHWKAVPGQRYAHTFVTSGNMKVTYDDQNGQGRPVKGLKMQINTASAYTKTLLAYMHELLHVCQQPEFDLLYDKLLRNGDKEIRWRFNRSVFIKEIEAFILMQKAYDVLLPHSPRLCSERPMYQAATKELRDGVFAQRVINWYSAPFKDHLSGLFQSACAKTSYPKSLLGPAFRMDCLHKDFVLDLEGRGIPVKRSQ